MCIYNEIAPFNALCFFVSRIALIILRALRRCSRVGLLSQLLSLPVGSMALKRVLPIGTGSLAAKQR